MIIENAHRLLKRQIKKANLTGEQLRSLSSFLNQINEAYHSNDEDYSRLENILEINSRELFKLNQALKSDVDLKTSEVAETKQQLELVINNVKNIIFQTDEKGNYTFLNSAWEDILGVKVEDSLGRKFTDFFQYVDEESQQKIQDFIKNPIGQFYQIIEIRTVQNVHKWIELTFEIILDENQKPSGTIGSLVDVTDLKKAQILLNQAKEAAEAANDSKSDFLNTMSHEIRTPLNSIIGLTNILLLEDHLEDQSENLHALKYSGEHLLHLINDILDFNKIIAGKLDLEQKDFSLDYVLDGLRKNFQILAVDKGCIFKIKKDEDIPKIVIGDRTRLYQILNNLISNAIKFTEKGKVELCLELTKKEENHIEILFEVIDTGIGIESSNIDKIFNSFEQADQSITRKFGGTGLGLAICKNLLKVMGSDIKVTSEVGVGSKFEFSLKYKISTNYDEKERNQAVDILSSFSGLQGKKILIAEDYMMNVLVLQRFFKRWEIEYKVAKNGQEALDMVQQEDFDCVFMDLQMPVMDGYQATKAIRALATNVKNIPIIALTATTQSSVKEKAIESGVDSFISKPFNPIHLFNTTKDVINQSKLK